MSVFLVTIFEQVILYHEFVHWHRSCARGSISCSSSVFGHKSGDALLEAICTIANDRQWWADGSCLHRSFIGSRTGSGSLVVGKEKRVIIRVVGFGCVGNDSTTLRCASLRPLDSVGFGFFTTPPQVS